MKYLKPFNEGKDKDNLDEIISTIKEICLDIQDEGIKVEVNQLEDHWIGDGYYLMEIIFHTRNISYESLDILIESIKRIISYALIENIIKGDLDSSLRWYSARGNGFHVNLDSFKNETKIGKMLFSGHKEIVLSYKKSGTIIDHIKLFL